MDKATTPTTITRTESHRFGCTDRQEWFPHSKLGARLQADTADAKYKQTLRQLFKVKPTPVMQELDKDIKEPEQKVKNAPEAMMDDNFLYDEKHRKDEERGQNQTRHQKTTQT